MVVVVVVCGGARSPVCVWGLARSGQMRSGGTLGAVLGVDALHAVGHGAAAFGTGVVLRGAAETARDVVVLRRGRARPERAL